MEEPYDSAQNPSGGRAFESHLKSRSTWLRLFFMIVLAFFYGVSRIVTVVVVVAQFCYVLFTGETNRPLRDLGLSLATFSNETASSEIYTPYQHAAPPIGQRER